MQERSSPFCRGGFKSLDLCRQLGWNVVLLVLLTSTHLKMIDRRYNDARGRSIQGVEVGHELEEKIKSARRIEVSSVCPNQFLMI